MLILLFIVGVLYSWHGNAAWLGCVWKNSNELCVCVSAVESTIGWRAGVKFF